MKKFPKKEKNRKAGKRIHFLGFPKPNNNTNEKKSGAVPGGGESVRSGCTRSTAASSYYQNASQRKLLQSNIVEEKTTSWWNRGHDKYNTPLGKFIAEKEAAIPEEESNEDIEADHTTGGQNRFTRDSIGKIRLVQETAKKKKELSKAAHKEKKKRKHKSKSSRRRDPPGLEVESDGSGTKERQDQHKPPTLLNPLYNRKLKHLKKLKQKFKEKKKRLLERSEESIEEDLHSKASSSKWSSSDWSPISRKSSINSTFTIPCVQDRLLEMTERTEDISLLDTHTHQSFTSTSPMSQTSKSSHPMKTLRERKVSLLVNEEEKQHIDIAPTETPNKDRRKPPQHLLQQIKIALKGEKKKSQTAAVVGSDMGGIKTSRNIRVNPSPIKEEPDMTTARSEEKLLRDSNDSAPWAGDIFVPPPAAESSPMKILRDTPSMKTKKKETKQLLPNYLSIEEKQKTQKCISFSSSKEAESKPISAKTIKVKNKSSHKQSSKTSKKSKQLLKNIKISNTKDASKIGLVVDVGKSKPMVHEDETLTYKGKHGDKRKSKSKESVATKKKKRSKKKKRQKHKTQKYRSKKKPSEDGPSEWKLHVELGKKKKLLDASDQKIQKFEKTINAQFAKVEELEEELRKANEESFLLEDKLQHMENKLAESLQHRDEKPADREREFDEKRQARLERRLEEKNKELQKLREGRNHLLNTLVPKDELDQLERDKKMLLDVLNREKALGLELMKEATSEIDDLKNKLKQVRRKSSVTKPSSIRSNSMRSFQRESMRSIQSIGEETVSELLQENDELHEQLELEKSRSSAILQKKDDTIDFMQLEIKKLRKQLDSKGVSKSKREIERSRSEDTFAKTQIEGLKQRNRILEEDVQHWKSVSCDLEDDLAAWKSQAAQLKDAVDADAVSVDTEESSNVSFLASLVYGYRGNKAGARRRGSLLG